MSQVLRVFAPRLASRSEVARVARDVGCVLEPEVHGWWFVATNSAPPDNRFFVAEPNPDSTADLPPVVATALHELGLDATEPACHFLQVPAGFAGAWPIMLDAACALAAAVGGVVLDPSDERVLWPERFADLEVPLAAGVRINTLAVSWYGSPTAEGPGWARRILEVAQAAFPEAIPVAWERWGLDNRTRPRPFRWIDVEEFEQASTVDMIVWDATTPFFSGSLTRVTNAEGGNRARYPGPFSQVEVSLNAAALEDPHRHRQLLDLIPRIADEIAAVYAHAQLNRNMLYRDGMIFGGGVSKPAGFNFVGSGTRCIGLPPRGVWLEWFGKPYLPYVTDALANIARPAGSGLLAEYGPDETVRATHLPAELIQGPGTRRAAIIPPM